jgi:hypothetical protein
MKELDMATTVIILYSAMMLMQVVLNILFYIKIRNLKKENKKIYMGAVGPMGPKGERGEPGYTPTPDYIKELIKQVNNEHKG